MLQRCVALKIVSFNITFSKFIMFFNDFLTKDTIGILILFVSRYKIILDWLGCPRVCSLLYDGRISSEQDQPEKTTNISRGNQYGCFLRLEQDEQVIVHRHLKQITKATLGKISCTVYDIFVGFIKDKETMFYNNVTI